VLGHRQLNIKALKNVDGSVHNLMELIMNDSNQLKVRFHLRFQALPAWSLERRMFVHGLLTLQL
jgi:hypothetical protein